jgi:hypothetical protein
MPSAYCGNCCYSAAMRATPSLAHTPRGPALYTYAEPKKIFYWPLNVSKQKPLMLQALPKWRETDALPERAT